MHGRMTSEREDLITLICGGVTLLISASVFIVTALSQGGTPMTVELPLADGWTLPLIPTSRGWDVLVAPVWAMFMVRFILDNRSDIVTALATLSGLTMAGTVYFMEGSEPGALRWIVCAPVSAIIFGRIANLIDATHYRKNDLPVPPFGFGDALYWCLAFGLGMLLPFAFMNGFLIATMFPFIGYMTVCVLLCTVLFGILGAVRRLHTLIFR